MLLTWGYIATLISNTAWGAVKVAQGQVLLLAILVLYPFLLYALMVVVQREREYQRIGRSMPVHPVEWLVLGWLVFFEAALWAVTL